MLPDLNDLPENKDEKPIVPKSEYDENGIPKLTIPDLDDVNLMGELDKYFGKESD